MKNDSPSVFLSYARHDEPLARELASGLSDRGLSVWRDESLAPGAVWDVAVRDAIEKSVIYVVVITSMFLESRFATLELGALLSASRKKGRILIPVLVPPVDFSQLPANLASFQALRLVDDDVGRLADQIAESVGAQPYARDWTQQERSLAWRGSVSPARRIRLWRSGFLATLATAGLVAGTALLWSIRTHETAEEARKGLAMLEHELAQRRPPTLSGSDLSDSRLDGAELRGAFLERVDLSRASLAGTDLRDSDLSQAVLVGADLSRADLTGADLRGANLQDALLRSAVMKLTRLDGAFLLGADLSGSDISGADLTGVFGLTQEQLFGACGSDVKVPEELVVRDCGLSSEEDPVSRRRE